MSATSMFANDYPWQPQMTGSFVAFRGTVATGAPITMESPYTYRSPMRMTSVEDFNDWIVQERPNGPALRYEDVTSPQPTRNPSGYRARQRNARKARGDA